MKSIFIHSTIAAAILTVSCSDSGSRSGTASTTEKPGKYTINSNLHGCASLQIQRFQINASQGEQIKTTDGARILIPAGSFVDASGKAIEGNVTVTYKAIQSIEEIIASGIPMQAFDGKRNGQFISDGMFEIAATSNGSEVKIADGKSLAVFTPSRDPVSDFKYWYFNTSKGAWEETGTRDRLSGESDISGAAQSAGLNPKSGITAFNLRWKIPSKPFFLTASGTEDNEVLSPGKIIPGKYNPKKMTLDLRFNENLYPDLAAYSSVMWQYAGTNELMDPENNKWIFQSTWSHVELTPKKDDPGVFDLAIHTNGTIYRTIVRPVVSGNDAVLADKNYEAELEKMKKLQAENAEKGASETQITQNMYNAFRVNKMGLYNCDRFYSDPEAADYTINFEVDGHELAHNQPIYVLMDGKKNVLQYSAGQPMRINPETIDAIFTVAAQGAIAAAGIERISGLKAKRGGSAKLKMEKVQVKITGLGSLRSAIEAL